MLGDGLRVMVVALAWGSMSRWFLVERDKLKDWRLTVLIDEEVEVGEVIVCGVVKDVQLSLSSLSQSESSRLSSR